MKGKIFHYELSQESDHDLEEIFDYTADKFGIDQAIVYLSGLEDVFDSLCNNPKLGRERQELKRNLRSIAYQSHAVFYVIHKDCIFIVRILHGSRDISRYIDP